MIGDYFANRGESASKTRTGSLRETFNENKIDYLFLMPVVLFLVFLMWLPFLRGVWMSLHEWPILGEHTFIGIQNYTYLFGWQPFLTSIKVTAIFVITTFLQLAVALVAALGVKNLSRFENIISGTFLIPYTMPPVITGTIWLYLLNPTFGAINLYLVDIGIINNTISWSINGTSALGVVIFVSTWTFWPFMFLILLASLQNIPAEQYESAKIYGANRLQMFRKVTLPQLKSAIIVAVSIRTIWNLSKVSQPLQLTNGGPGYETSLLAVLLYRFTTKRGALGLSFAIGIILLIITLVFIALFLREFDLGQREVT